jgi:hypothetical protein
VTLLTLLTQLTVSLTLPVGIGRGAIPVNGDTRRARVPVSGPSPERYAKFLLELGEYQARIAAGEDDPLAVGSAALLTVIEFLNSDATALEGGLANPLSMIANALHDCRHGGRPSLLFDRPKEGGRPTDQTFDAVKASIATALDILLLFKISRSEAGKFVATEARLLGFRRPDRKAITGRTVLGWRDEIMVSKSAIGAEVYRSLKAVCAAKRLPDDINEAKGMARDILVQARLAGFLVTHDAK